MSIKIITHNGAFHADEALAVYLLKQLPLYRNASVVRTRDPAIIASGNIVVDVGAVYDHATFRYDHHQASFTSTFSPSYTTKLSSAGLIYLHYGQEVLGTSSQTLFEKVYRDFIHAFDGVDNGVNQYEGSPKAVYSTGNHTIFSMVGALNPRWNQPEVSADAQFEKAVQLVGNRFSEYVSFLKEAWMPARQLVEEAIKARSRPEILVMEKSCPWKEHLFDIEKEMGIESQILYVIYKDVTNGDYRIQCVPTLPDSFESRKALPTSWRGLRADELSALSTIPDCVFVHATGFIGGAKSLESVIKMAEMSIDL